MTSPDPICMKMLPSNLPRSQSDDTFQTSKDARRTRWQRPPRIAPAATAGKPSPLNHTGNGADGRTLAWGRQKGAFRGGLFSFQRYGDRP